MAQTLRDAIYSKRIAMNRISNVAQMAFPLLEVLISRAVKCHVQIVHSVAALTEELLLMDEIWKVAA